jgi:hypothetical protein
MTGEEALNHAIWAAREAEEAATGHEPGQPLRRTVTGTEQRRANYPKATALAGVAQAWAAIAAIMPEDD